MVNDKDVTGFVSDGRDRLGVPAIRNAVAFATGLLVVLCVSDASAQRGGQHLNSPGYQRALIESRRPKPELAPPATTLKTKRPRRVRGR